MSAKEELAKEVRELREQRGLSLSELGRRAHLSTSYISQIESAKLGTPPLEAPIVAIGHVLEATEEQIDYWVSLTGKLRQQRMLEVLGIERNLQNLATATGLAAMGLTPEEIRKLVATTVAGVNQWPE